MDDPKTSDPYGWRTEGQDIVQGIASGAIVGMPLLYTMEMWFNGMLLTEWHLLAVLVATLLANVAFNLLSGFREEHSLASAVLESFTAVGIALVFSAAVLWLVGELQWAEGHRSLIGKILLEAAAVSIGISFANSQVRGRSRTEDEGGKGDDDRDKREGKGEYRKDHEKEEETERDKKAKRRAAGDRQLKMDLREAGAALAGATLFSLNVAPTEEILLIATQLTPLRELALLAAGFVFCYLILFAAEFKKHQVHVPSLFQHPISETILTCAISLAVAGVLLVLLGERAILQEPATAASAIVVLGLPAIVGGAAGRLIT